MPIARRHHHLPRRRRAAETAAAAVVAALAVPAMPATAAATTPDCTVGPFTASSQADLAKITMLDPGPLHRELPTLTDVRLASSRGDADSEARPHKSVATAKYADAKLLGIPLTRAAAIDKAPRNGGPASVDLAQVDVSGLATVKAGTATAEATWEDAYRCGKAGPLTRSATMLAGFSVLGGSHGVPAIHAINDLTHTSHKTSLLRVGASGSTQSATDLVRLPGGQVGVRAGAGVTLGDLSLFGGSPQEIGIKVVNQPTLEAVAASDRRHSTVDYRPAMLEISSGGKVVTTLKEAGADVSLSLIGGLDKHKGSALEVRLSLGRATSDIGKRTVSAEAATLRVEVKIGQAHLLDVALGRLKVSACAPAAGKSSRGDHGGYQSSSASAAASASPAPASSAPVTSRPGAATPAVPRPVKPQPSASASRSASPKPSVTPVALGEPLPGDGGTGGGALALTGANVTVLGIGGVALVLFGTVALPLGRRRRSASGS
ncbi:hypothetical protein [Actinoplanes sp. DH11]|uniref:hypothetical protein n=1 Tax=Actinoplanes sp. DH11 TaxID=2857011 RepID=UPI001E3C6E7A|nr:hypothetical protein [Actinoplanes sp. DH11]